MLSRPDRDTIPSIPFTPSISSFARLPPAACRVTLGWQPFVPPPQPCVAPTNAVPIVIPDNLNLPLPVLLCTYPRQAGHRACPEQTGSSARRGTQQHPPASQPIIILTLWRDWACRISRSQTKAQRVTSLHAAIVESWGPTSWLDV
jgi:hypothetical protein